MSLQRPSRNMASCLIAAIALGLVAAMCLCIGYGLYRVMGAW